MTENEAINRIRYRIDTASDIVGKGVDGKAYEDMEMAIKALEEIQQYRAIGTVEECREARERQREKKPVYSYLKSLPTCPNCGEVNLQHENEYGNVDANYDFCPDCGQAIDWSDNE